MSIGVLQTEADLKRFGDQHWARPVSSVAPIVAALPGSPSNGQRVVYRPAAGAMWSLAFDQEAHDLDGYGWVALGAAPFARHLGSNNQATSSSSWVSLSGGPSITVPVAALYEISFGALAILSAASSYAEMTARVNASAEFASALADVFSGGAASVGASTFGFHAEAAVPAGGVVETRYRLAGSGSANFNFRWLRVQPLRLAS